MKLLKTAVCTAFIIALLSGCSGRMLNDMTIVQAISLDEINGEVYLGIQYLDLNKGSGKNEGLNSSLTENAYSKGKTVEEAVKNLSKTLPDDYFTGQAKLMVLSRSFREKRLDELKAVIIKDNRVRPDILIAECRGKASDVLKNPFRNERVPIDGICKQLKRSKAEVTANDFLKNPDVQLPVISLGKNYGTVTIDNG